LSTTSEGSEGNKIIGKIKKCQRFPIFVVSGFPQDLEDSFSGENAFFKVYKRDQKEFKEILNEIVSIYKTDITKILGSGANSIIFSIGKKLQELFWSHLSYSFDEISKSSMDTQKVLKRYTLTQLIEHLSVDEFISPELYYPGEMYVFPPFQKQDHLATGILLKEKDTGNVFIILTPLCDMVIRKKGRKAKRISLVRIEEIDGVLSANKKQEKKLFKNNFCLYYHFLPPAQKFIGGFINFQHINSKEEKEIDKNFLIIGKVAAPFLKDIISRFSSYYARQGQPEIDIQSINAKF